MISPQEKDTGEKDAGDESPVAPATCHSMVDVRREIDRVDRLIVRLIAERQNYIEQAGCIKQSRDAVRDVARVEDVVEKVVHQAGLEGANPALVETVYRTMIEWCINYEFTIFDKKPPRR